MEKQFDRSSFMKVLWKLMLPIVLQNLLSAVRIAVYAVLCMDEFFKLPFVALRFRRYKWLKNLTGNR
ncbi:MAG: hypothetical protein IJI45_12740 [Anaerolineaceae bacterium]|nr:hypothetical protein [Anaerolineaceae bacterium]